jgi:hypothetical protein
MPKTPPVDVETVALRYGAALSRALEHQVCNNLPLWEPPFIDKRLIGTDINAISSFILLCQYYFSLFGGFCPTAKEVAKEVARIQSAAPSPPRYEFAAECCIVVNGRPVAAPFEANARISWKGRCGDNGKYGPHGLY